VSETSRKNVRAPQYPGVPAGEDQKTSGLDLREFDHAIVFKVALMGQKISDRQPG
jgi:hypothetical protein